MKLWLKESRFRTVVFLCPVMMNWSMREQCFYLQSCFAIVANNGGILGFVFFFSSVGT